MSLLGVCLSLRFGRGGRAMSRLLVPSLAAAALVATIGYEIKNVSIVLDR